LQTLKYFWIKIKFSKWFCKTCSSLFSLAFLPCFFFVCVQLLWNFETRPQPHSRLPSPSFDTRHNNQLKDSSCCFRSRTTADPELHLSMSSMGRPLINPLLYKACSMQPYLNPSVLPIPFRHHSEPFLVFSLLLPCVTACNCVAFVRLRHLHQSELKISTPRPPPHDQTSPPLPPCKQRCSGASSRPRHPSALPQHLSASTPARASLSAITVSPRCPHPRPQELHPGVLSSPLRLRQP
jgi:hypothetical protein